MIVPSWLISILAWAPAMGMKATDKTEVPGIYKVIIPVILFGVLAVMAGITIFAILEVLKKTVKLEEVEESKMPPLASGEMTKFERESRIAPVVGKVVAVFFIFGLILFMLGGMYTMGRGSGTTDQLRKEGLERQKKADARKKAAEASGGGAVGGDDSGGGGDSEFGGSLDGMKK